MQFLMRFLMKSNKYPMECYFKSEALKGSKSEKNHSHQSNICNIYSFVWFYFTDTKNICNLMFKKSAIIGVLRVVSNI